MKTLGIILFAIGAYLLGTAFTMDTSVEVDYSYGNSSGLPTRVNNLGLMQDKQNYMILGAILTISGIALGSVKSKEAVVVEDYKKCPQCAENVKEEALICRFCKYDFRNENHIDRTEIDRVVENSLKNLNKNIA